MSADLPDRRPANGDPAAVNWRRRDRCRARLADRRLWQPDDDDQADLIGEIEQYLDDEDDDG